MKFTFSVKSFQVPDTPRTSAWPPSLPSVPTSLATRVTSDANESELVHHRVDGVLEGEDLTLDLDRDLARQKSPLAIERGDLREVAHLGGEVARHRVDRSVSSFHDAGDARHDRLAAQLALGADLACDARDFGRKAAQPIHHRVDGVLELQKLAAHVHRDLL